MVLKQSSSTVAMITYIYLNFLIFNKIYIKFMSIQYFNLQPIMPVAEADLRISTLLQLIKMRKKLTWTL